MSHPDTLPKSLIAGYQKYGDRKIAMRKKDMGIWRIAILRSPYFW